MENETLLIYVVLTSRIFWLHALKKTWYLVLCESLTDFRSTSVNHTANTAANPLIGRELEIV